MDLVQPSRAATAGAARVTNILAKTDAPTSPQWPSRSHMAWGEVVSYSHRPYTWRERRTVWIVASKQRDNATLAYTEVKT